MPRWTFELAPDTLSAGEKDMLAKHITEAYIERGIPAFLVNVFFHENQIGCFYSRVETPPNAYLSPTDHAARRFPSEEERLSFIARVNAIVEPILVSKGLKWEYNIYRHPPDNWRVSGMVPPVADPEIWYQWIARDSAVPYREYLEGEGEQGDSLRKH